MISKHSSNVTSWDKDLVTQTAFFLFLIQKTTTTIPVSLLGHQIPGFWPSSTPADLSPQPWCPLAPDNGETITLFFFFFFKWKKKDKRKNPNQKRFKITMSVHVRTEELNVKLSMLSTTKVLYSNHYQSHYQNLQINFHINPIIKICSWLNVHINFHKICSLEPLHMHSTQCMPQSNKSEVTRCCWISPNASSKPGHVGLLGCGSATGNKPERLGQVLFCTECDSATGNTFGNDRTGPTLYRA